MTMGGKKTRTVALALVALAAAAGAFPAGEASGQNEEGHYDAPASYAVAPVLGVPIFGIGVLTCDTGQAGDVNVASTIPVYNGACWDVGHEHDGHLFQVAGADDNFGADVSLSVVFDYTGDGRCQSGSCGVPDQARFSGCGAVTGTVPTGRAGTTVWVFVRVVDVNPLSGRLCFASQGDLYGSF